jgi:methyl-accepting chemotaxis protein-1 (serine sensor receptor)
MGDINQSSAKIADIITIIEGIAFQTNILALNAAVEAARAGEEGRGFAVVAGEVRTLAQRSSAAAKEIKELIDTSVARVQTGTSLVDEAGRTMNEIIGAVQRVTDIMGEIAAASEEQSSGIDQVARAVTQMDEVTQQNAALVEEAAAAAQSLEDQAGALRTAVETFRLNDEATAGFSAIATPKAKARVTTVAKPVQKSAPKAAVRAPAAAPKLAATAGGDWETF